MARERRRAAVPLAAALLAALLDAAAAAAAVEGSPHDLVAQDYDNARGGVEQARCRRCHLPAGVEAGPVHWEVPPSLRQYGAQSLTCFSCHDGTTIVSPEVDASATAFHPDSHGLRLEPYRSQFVEGLELPYLKGERMECNTCHDPHDNSRRPFLRAEIPALCLYCHPQSAEYALGKDNRSGNHPLDFDPVRAARREAPLSVSPPFRVPFPQAYPAAGGRRADGVHWDLGGHLAKGDAGEVVCTSCHALHGDEASPPVPGLLAVPEENVSANRFCEGCHQGKRGDGVRSGDAPNPGGSQAGRTYHPCDDDIANGEGRIVDIRVPEGWPFGKGTPPRLLCSTCHDAHGGRIGTPILRAPVAATTFCEECHDQMPLYYHHPVGLLEDGKCLTTLPPPEYGEGKGLSCAHCHRAHNAGFGAPDERRFTPLLRFEAGDAGQCARCHPNDNPTCGNRSEFRASHFIGDPSLPDTYSDAKPPLRREPWPESGYRSIYAGERELAVTCLSCHLFKRGAVVSGDDGKSSYLIARSGNPVEWPADSEDGETFYLCTGCHGVTPGTGAGEVKSRTHPLMNADAAKLGRRPVAPATTTANQRVNCDSCHRPHEAATGAGYYILEIIKSENLDPRAIQPQIDFTVVCHRCHDPQKY